MVERRTAVEINRVLDHMDFEGNERVNEAAKKVVERVGKKRCPERFTSLTHVKLTISERKLKETKQRFRIETDRRYLLQRAWYNSALKI